MYHKQLQEDLIKIFGIKKVVFSSVEYGAEEDVLYCDITTEFNKPRNGYYYFRISGNIGFNAQYGNTTKGFFHYKWLDSKYADKSRLDLTGFESNVNFPVMNKYFCKSRIDFVYTLKMPFNPSQKTRGFIAKFFSFLKKDK